MHFLRRVLPAGFGLALAATTAAPAQNTALDARIAQLAAQEESKVIAWRRDIHEHPELGNLETRTAGIIAAHLKKLGFEVQTGVARTGVVGILRGG
ncbi:MAG: amidohydrolase, partial [Bacteroidota bacterium]|nr:amidohydrolase [Bacteroidota bacterium]